MHKDATEILVIFFNTVIQSFNMFLIEKTQNMLLQLPASLAWDDLHNFDPFVDRFLNDIIKA